MYKLLLRLVIYFAIKDKSRFLRLLAKIEYGVATFCFKLQRQAEEESLCNLAIKLRIHGNEEKKHGKMLSCAADGNKPVFEGTGRWVSMLRESGESVHSSPNCEDVEAKTVTWDSQEFPGEKLTGTFENFDGISKRYLATRILFRGKAAADYSWEDKLAFMYVLEEETATFYRCLMDVHDSTVKAIALQITGDELNHANYLKSMLANFAPLPQAAIDKWRDRLWLAKWCLVVDAIKFLLQK